MNDSEDMDAEGRGRALLRWLRGWPGIAFALFALNFFLTLRLPYGDPFEHVFQVSPDLLGILAVVWLLAKPSRLERHRYSVPLLLVLVVLRLFAVGESIMIRGFNRTLNLYSDATLVPELFRLLQDLLANHMTVGFGTYLALTLAGIGLACALLFFVLRWLGRQAARDEYRRPLLFAGLASPALAMLAAPLGISVFAPSISARVGEEVDFILHVKGFREAKGEEIRRAKEEARRIPTDLAKLDGADVYLIFIESYGYTVVGNPEHRQRIAPAFDRLSARLEGAGMHSATGFVDSPTYGGASWLAHASLLSGVRVESQFEYDLLLRSDTPTLAHFFNEQGYRTISAAPGTQREFPEGAFYGFDDHYYAWHFGYKGPKFGWATMPDQFVLDYLYRKEVKDAETPLFAEIVLVSCHASFAKLPAYVEDYDQIGDGSIFNEIEAVTFPVRFPAMDNAEEAYSAAVRYDLRVIGDFILRTGGRRALFLVLGDHQPATQVTGKGQPAFVPMHAISSDPSLVEPFLKRGFHSGVRPVIDQKAIGMERLLHHFLADFSGQGNLTRRKAVAPDVEPGADTSIPPL